MQHPNSTMPDNRRLSEILDHLGIYLPEPVNPDNIAPPKQKLLPIQEQSLQNFITHVTNGTSADFSGSLEKPKNYKLCRYINKVGDCNFFWADPDDITAICRSLSVRYHLRDGRVAMPDYIGGIRIDRAVLENVLANRKSFATNGYYNNWYETAINGMHIICNASWDSHSDDATTTENIIRGKYLRAMMQQVYKKLRENRMDDWSNIPKTYQDIQRAICEYKNQWQPEEKAQYKKQERLTPKSKDVWLLITKINRPEFFRYPGNKNNKTFDFIEIHIGIRTKESMAGRNDMIKRCIKDLIRIGFQEIQNNRKFNEFGIPIEFLKPTKYVVTKADEIIVTYELKTKASG